MAAESPMESLQEEVTCPVCLEYFTEPVSLECGHHFCQACISQCWEGSDTAASCPQCRETVQQRNLRPNRKLANIALKLFCEEDQTPICVICRESRAHRAHRVVPIQEAAQEYKVLRCCPKQTETERQKIVSEFQQLQQFLEAQEQLLLAQLEKLDEEIVKIQSENITKLSEEVSCLSELISELEGKCQKPASECLSHVYTSWVSPWSIQHPLPLRALPTVKMVPASHRTELLNVTLDPDTAHPNLVLSEDRKRVRQGNTWQQLPNHPERFDSWGCVLGCEGFTSGRHCWEVEVGAGGYWAVGVARESVRRKGWISRSPKGGIWAVGCWGDQFQALTSPVTPLPLSRAPSRIRVCLDCDRGQVTFIDAGDEAPIFTFPPDCNSLIPYINSWPLVLPSAQSKGM
uniref:Zinc finger protein RFP-like n=1 Tax=Chelonoidis abingdonii TaxID=106734 RepID=A0A8C0H8B2_CHEAB